MPVLMLLHVLVGAALMGALTHQAFSSTRRPPQNPGTFVSRFRGVHAPAFATVVVVLYAFSCVFGGVIYARYRVDVRPTLEDLQLRAANGAFEIKEHFAAVGLGLLPAYWRVWSMPHKPEYAAARRYLAWILCFSVYWNFIVGQVLNNIRGIFP
jgi:hypothetical protein